MSATNPFHEREPFKKRVLTVSVTAEQMAAFDTLRGQMGSRSVSEAIKALIAEEIDRRAKSEQS